MRICHVVVTNAFAGTERYVVEVAKRQAAVGHQVTVVGGDPAVVPSKVLPASWLPGATPAAAARSITAGGRVDVTHSHLTAADAVVAVTAPVHRGRHVSTRHIAAVRGRSRVGRFALPLIRRSVSLEIAISHHVAAALEQAPHAVLHNGVESTDVEYDPGQRVVLVLQRLEKEKDTATALHAWRRGNLTQQGWTLAIAGDGRQRADLERLRDDLGLEGVDFLGQVDGLAELGRATILLATATSEPLGLSVLEAMARGVPVVATRSGGHLETLPASWPGHFAPGDAHGCAAALARVSADPDALLDLGRGLRRRQRELFDVDRHVDVLLELYASPATRRGPRA